jgi:hypothetical protein
MNSNIILPMELVNKILIMRAPHPITEIINPLICYYHDYTNDDDYITFYEFQMNYRDLYYNYNVRINKKYDNNLLRCYGCNYHFESGDLYFSNSYAIMCNKCC